MAKKTELYVGQRRPHDDASMIDATRRIHQIIDDADRQAGQIIMNAEVEARQYVQGVRQKTDEEAEQYARAMASLSDALISQAEALSRESQRLLSNIGDGVVPLARNGTEPSQEVTETLREVTETAQQEFEPDVTQSFSAGARLLATQMAVAGSTREDIRDRLVNDFGIGDPEPLLDSILGAG